MLRLAEDASAILRDAGMTILIGVVVVFAMLLLLTGVFKLFGMFMTGLSAKKKTQPGENAVVAAPAAVPVVGNTQPVTTTPEVQNGIPEETVVAIAAAVATMAPAGTQYAVRDIRKK